MLPCERVPTAFPRGARPSPARTARKPCASPQPARLTYGAESTARLPGRGGGTLTDGRAVKEECHAEEHADAQGEDEGPPAAPAQGAAVAGGADDGREDEAEDGAQEPGEAVVLLRKACSRHGAAVTGEHAQTHVHTCPRGQRRHCGVQEPTSELGDLKPTNARPRSIRGPEASTWASEQASPTAGHRV